MKTHGEVQAAIDAGKQLQGVEPEVDEWFDIDPVEASAFPPGLLRIKPEPPQRLECWSYHKPRGDAWSVYDRSIGSEYVRLREVRPGDLTREEIEERIDACLKAGWSAYDFRIRMDDIRRIFLGPSDE